MDFDWVAIALNDITWVVPAFALGLTAKLLHLPPMVGFLAAGFLLNYSGFESTSAIEKLADLGITLLLFTVGLKLNLKTLTKPQVWAVSIIHTGLFVAVIGALIWGLALAKISLFEQLSFNQSLLLAFAFCFSSTVFVVKALEDKGEMKSLHGRIAIGILIMQDLAAVFFLVASTNKLPSLWAPLLFLLIPLRPLLHNLLQRSGHGELEVLYGLVIALGGAQLFELFSVKGDLGALIFGVLLASHPKARELANSMLNFKDIFLVGFFLTVGLSTELSLEAILVGTLIVPLILIKSALFFALLSQFGLKARTSLFTSINLTNFSEFGLIVVAIGASNGWLDGSWLAALSVGLTLSFVIASILSAKEDDIYNAHRPLWLRFQKDGERRLKKTLNLGGANVMIFGMGRVGTGAYEKMHHLYGGGVVGIDFDADLVEQHTAGGRNVLKGDPRDGDFWDRLDKGADIKLVMLALPCTQATLDTLEQLKGLHLDIPVAVIGKFPDEEEMLIEAGANTVFNLYTEAGVGFADHTAENFRELLA